MKFIERCHETRWSEGYGSCVAIDIEVEYSGDGSTTMFIDPPVIVNQNGEQFIAEDFYNELGTHYVGEAGSCLQDYGFYNSFDLAPGARKEYTACFTTTMNELGYGNLYIRLNYDLQGNPSGLGYVYQKYETSFRLE